MKICRIEFQAPLCVYTAMAQAPVLELTLSPHRSLGPGGFKLLIGAVALVCGINALRFLALKAWPVALFLALDVALVYWAFKANYRSGRAYEKLTIAQGELRVAQVSPLGVRREHVFNAHWVQVILEQINQVQNRLLLVMHGRKLEIGSFLAPFERDDVKAEIERGLRQARNP
jgi:uncharacterized membrane protein